MTATKPLAEQLRFDGDTRELNDHQTLRLRIEYDGDVDPFEDVDCYGQVEAPSHRNSSKRPDGFDGNAEKFWIGNDGPYWWQPPAEVKRTSEHFAGLRRLVKDLIQYGYLTVVIELLEGEDAYGKPIVTNVAALGGIDSLEDGYLAVVVGELIDELDLPDPDLCSVCQDHPAMDEGTYAGLCRDCGHQAFLEDKADDQRDER